MRLGACCGGFSRSVEVLTGWLLKCLSPCLGWLSNEVFAGWFPWLWRGSKEARAHRPQSGLSAAVSVADRKGIAMSVMIGIDPHKGSHTAVVVDDDEVVIDTIRVRTSVNQMRTLQDWASGYDVRCWAIESARGLGYLLAQQLVAAGEQVVDVPPMMASRVRVLGSGKSQKNDPNDARSVAISALRHPNLTVVGRDDHAQVLGLLAKRHRDIARLKNKAACRLHALLMELKPGGLASEMTVNKANTLLASVDPVDQVARQRVVIANELVDDIVRFNTQMLASKKRIRIAVVASGTSLCDIRGIGPIGAAMILGSVGDIARFPAAGHFASYNATAPIEASSGNKNRHRLNPRGNRKLNHVLHMAAVSQLRYPSQGRTYYDKKITEGKTPKEAIRALKRRISGVVYRRLVADGRRHRQSTK